MKVVTLGFCCKKSKQNHENVKQACELCGVESPINVADMQEIVKYGVMSTPATVINGKVVSTGRMLTVEQAKALIENNK